MTDPIQKQFDALAQEVAKAREAISVKQKSLYREAMDLEGRTKKVTEREEKVTEREDSLKRREQRLVERERSFDTKEKCANEAFVKLEKRLYLSTGANNLDQKQEKPEKKEPALDAGIAEDRAASTDPSTDATGLPQASHSLVHSPSGTYINGEEYVKATQLDKFRAFALKSRELVAHTQLSRDKQSDALKKAEEKNERREKEFQAKLKELKLERAKVTTFEAKQKKDQQLLKLICQSLDRIRKEVAKAQKSHEARSEMVDNWMDYLVNHGKARRSDLYDFPGRSKWPDFDGPLARLSETTASHILPPPKPIFDMPPLHNNFYALEAIPGEEDYTGKNEEPESALANFSPTSKAVMRQPGPETLAVLHPSIYVGPNVPASSQDAKESMPQTEKKLPTRIKNEPLPSQELGSYDKYGYNRQYIGEDRTLDLDKVAGGTPHPESPVDGDTSAVKAEPVTSPVHPSALDENRSALQEIAEPNTRLPSEGIKEEDGVHIAPRTAYLLSTFAAEGEQGDKFPPRVQRQDVSHLFKWTEEDVVNLKEAAEVYAEAQGPTYQPKPLAAMRAEMYRMREIVKLRAMPRTDSHKRQKPLFPGRDPRKRVRTRPGNKTNSDPFTISNYRIDPDKNDGVDFAYTEVVRDKARKACLPTCVKACCKDLASGKFEEMWQPPQAYQAPKFSAQDSSQPDAEEEELMQQHEDYKQWRVNTKKSEQALKFGKHKAQHEKAEEIKHFWTSEFLDTQQLEEQKVDSERRYREKAFKVYDECMRGGKYVQKTHKTV
ncbi:hypothetical protein TWF696_003419 [Orbilia brochopaga]|uniref:DNA endonuclease activator Ctp1 C-terminal domain-containing protein n=1 Tax=Orbilia brochopaga TaxID=3140254 RepID=A0AAV9TXQ5_9PEZI